MTMIIIDMCDVQGWTRDAPLNPSAPDASELCLIQDETMNNWAVFSEVKHQQSFRWKQNLIGKYEDTHSYLLHTVCFSLSVETGPSNFSDCGFCFWSEAASCATLLLNMTQIKQKKVKKKTKQNNFNNQAKRCCMSNRFSLGVYKLTDWLTWLPS